MCGLSCLGADVAAKAAFLLGAAGPAWLDVRGIPGRFVTIGRRCTRERRVAAEPRASRVHLTSNPVDWYAARAAGITAYLLLSAVVLLGLTMAAKKTFARWPRFTVEDVHRFGGLLVGTFVAIHGVTVAIDAWLPFSVQSLVVPFISIYRPLWVGSGIAAAELLFALAVTNHYRRRLPYTFWRRAHYLNFAVWGAATVHGVGSGTDRSAPWALAMFATAVSAVCRPPSYGVRSRSSRIVDSSGRGPCRSRRGAASRRPRDRATPLLPKALECG